MQQSHLFIMDPLEKLNFKLDTSLRIARELTSLGHQCHFTTVEGLSWNSQQRSPIAKSRPINFNNDEAESVELGLCSNLFLDSFFGIHMRKEPPFDKSYIASTWILDAVGKSTNIYNAPRALRDFNEKLGILQFKNAIAPALASSDPEAIYRFSKDQCNNDTILKPLDLYGGKGIVRLQTTDISKEKALKVITETIGVPCQVLLVQAFNTNIFMGEVRVFTLAGKALSWCLKVPSKGNYLANTSSGAELREYLPSETEKQMVDQIATNLYERGVCIAGLDIIDGFISEINITSPRLLQAPSDKEAYIKKIAKWIENDCQEKEGK